MCINSLKMLLLNFLILSQVSADFFDSLPYCVIKSEKIINIIKKNTKYHITQLKCKIFLLKKKQPTK
jgi:hypothetical protein